jgi:hypothetical protein
MTISNTTPVSPMLTTSFALLHQGRSAHGLLKKMPVPLGLFAIPANDSALGFCWTLQSKGFEGKLSPLHR